MSQSGEWIIQAHWEGDATNEPLDAECSVDVTAPIHMVTASRFDMICPPVFAPSGDPADLFGKYPDNNPVGVLIADRLHICRWSPAEGVYHVYGTDPTFPTLLPGDAFWVKPSKFWTAPSLTYSLEPYGQMVDQTQPRKISLLRGWNQFGSVFMQPFNWSDVQVIYNGVTMTLTAAARAGYIRDYAWGYDGTQYFLVHSTNNSAGVRRTIEPWIGYWIRVLVPNCDLILPPPGGGDDIPPPPGPLGMAVTDNARQYQSIQGQSPAAGTGFDSPPPAP
jgi:hypothetical protein